MAISPVLANAIMSTAKGPNLVDSFYKGEAMGHARNERREAKETKELSGQALMGQEGAMDKLSLLNPQAALTIQNAMGVRDQNGMKVMFQDYARASNLQGNAKYQFLQQAARRVANNGGDPSSLIDLMKLPEDELQQRLVQGVETGQQLGVIKRPPASEIKTFGKDGTGLYNSTTGRIVKEPAGNTAVGGGPDKVLEGLSSGAQEAGREAYILAGGGKDGMKALESAVTVTQEREKQDEVGTTIEQRFPDATDKEIQQLKNTANVAKTAEGGIKNAESLRVVQVQQKKGRQVKDSAYSLLKSILENEQLPDVLGSIEGAYDTRLFSDAESGLIADIEEVSNLLTAENLDMMTGVLSESDIKILRDIGSGGIKRTRSVSDFEGRVKEMMRILGGVDLSGGSGEGNAPQAAIDRLTQNPELAGDFKAKYGYLPAGFEE